MTFEYQWLEYDYNPFILFASDGKVLSLNAQAQFLLSVATPSELFKLATTYANISFGFKTTFLELEFSGFKFFAICVGYEDEEKIGIKFYRVPSFKLNNSTKPTGELTNIYTLVDLCISSNSINSNINFKKDFDPTIPEIIINASSFIKLLNKVYECFIDNDEIETKIFYRVGEHIKFEDKKYSLFSIQVKAKSLNKKSLDELELLATNTNFYVDTQKVITINLPMIIS